MTTFLKTAETYVAGARTLPGSYYTSAEVFEEEREQIGRHAWHCVGRAADAPTPGRFFLAHVAGECLVVVRGRDHALRAFYNTCRHRGTRLLDQEAGDVGQSIQCPYHAWTYATTGELVGAPHMHGVAGFDRADWPLHQAHLREWEGFLFVSLADEPDDFDAHFAPLLGRLSRFNLPALVAEQRIAYDVGANWKLVFQNFSECQHCPVIHPELNVRTPYQSGANDLVEGPFLGGFMEIAPGSDSLTMSGRACALPVGDLPPEDLRRSYYYTLMPNLMLSIHPDYVVYYTLWPDAPDRTRVECEWLFHPNARERGDFNPADAIEFWDTVNRQDWHICELSQLGVSSRAYTPGPYSPRESIPAAWDREYLRVMGRG
jgi:Rieske 2Fe-2S family protein